MTRIEELRARRAKIKASRAAEAMLDYLLDKVAKADKLAEAVDVRLRACLVEADRMQCALRDYRKDDDDTTETDSA